MFDRNYASNAIASESWLKTAPGTTDILLAASDRPYGANNFYGNYPEWERTKAWLGSIQQQLGSRTAASFGYLRHTDQFVLIVGQPSIYENNHITTSYEAALRRADDIGRNTTLAYGLEESGDTITLQLSNGSAALGVHARNQGAGYANLSLRSLGRFSLSLGAREEVLSSQGSVFSPNVAGAFTLTSTLRLRASAGHGFRLPTYVDLYYSDPATIGNPNLKPESSWSYEGGADWTPANGRLTLTAVGYRLNETNAIDYTKLLPSDPPARTGRPSTSPPSTSPAPKPARASASPPPSRSSSATPPTTPATCRPTTSPSTPSTTPRRTPSSPTPAPSASSPRTPRSTSCRRPPRPPTRSGTSNSTATPAPSAPTSACSTSAIPATRRSLNVPMQGRTIMGGMQFNWSKQ